MSLLSFSQLAVLRDQRVLAKADGSEIDFNQINAASVDITLGANILVEAAPYPEGKSPVLDFRARDKMNFQSVTMVDAGYVLWPGDFILAQSAEVFNLPNNLSCEYKLKSSMARIGLEHLNAGWCFTGDTQIPLLDGTTRPLASLVGQQHWVYSLDASGEFVPGFASRIWETKRVRATVVVQLDNDQTFECTPDHRIMLRGGGYKEAGSLVAGDSLMPLYRKSGQNGHEMVYSPSTVLKGKWVQPKGRWYKTHVLVDRHLRGELPTGYCVHHDNYLKVDNTPGNLQRMPSTEHVAMHNAERNRSQEQRAAASAAMARTNERLWQDPEYAARMTIRNASNAAATNNKRWGTPLSADEPNNHKVVSVQHRRHRVPVPVYDMTVDGHHNFAIGAGVFVHNCDAGWHGSVLTLEFRNLSRYHSIRIRPGDAIGQMVFFSHAEVPADRSYAARGRYNNDTTVSSIKE